MASLLTPPMTREELNDTAATLLSRAQLLLASRGGRSSDSDALTSLREDCQTLKVEIKQLKQQCAELPATPTQSREEAGASTTDLSVNEMRLKAELEILHREAANDDAVLSTDDIVKQTIAHQQLWESCSQLTQLLTALKTDRQRVSSELQSEQTLLKETRELETALESELATAQHKAGQEETSNAEMELRERIVMADESIRQLRESLVQFTMDEIIQPLDEMERGGGEGGGGGGGGRKRGRGQARLDAMLLREGGGGGKDGGNEFPSLAEAIQELVSRTLSSPHSPYLPLSSIWPPHGNLLMRSGVIQRHPDHPSLVRVTPFHL